MVETALRDAYHEIISPPDKAPDWAPPPLGQEVRVHVRLLCEPIRAGAASHIVKPREIDRLIGAGVRLSGVA
jgi:hypothetical protein